MLHHAGPVPGVFRRILDDEVRDAGTTASLADVWTSGPNDVWTVESVSTSPMTATFHHYDGVRFRSVTAPVGALRFGRLWGLARDDVYAIGVGNYPCENVSVLHWDGAIWTTTSLASGCGQWRHLPVGLALWGTRRDDVWAAGGTSAFHWDGHTWTETMPELPNAPGQYPLHFHDLQFAGFASNDVYLAGPFGEIRHWDGARWTSEHTGVALDLHGLWGASSDDLWAVGARGTIVRRQRTR